MPIYWSPERDEHSQNPPLVPVFKERLDDPLALALSLKGQGVQITYPTKLRTIVAIFDGAAWNFYPRCETCGTWGSEQHEYDACVSAHCWICDERTVADRNHARVLSLLKTTRFLSRKALQFACKARA